MSGLRRLWSRKGPFLSRCLCDRPVTTAIVVLLAWIAVLLIVRETCGLDPAPLGVRGTIDEAGRFVPAGAGDD